MKISKDIIEEIAEKVKSIIEEEISRELEKRGYVVKNNRCYVEGCKKPVEEYGYCIDHFNEIYHRVRGKCMNYSWLEFTVYDILRNLGCWIRHGRNSLTNKCNERLDKFLDAMEDLGENEYFEFRKK